jgi:hypothetical protein
MSIIRPDPSRCPHIRGGKIIDKVAVARTVIGSAADFGMLDLDRITTKLVDEIKRHNA